MNKNKYSELQLRKPQTKSESRGSLRHSIQNIADVQVSISEMRKESSVVSKNNQMISVNEETLPKRSGTVQLEQTPLDKC